MELTVDRGLLLEAFADLNRVIPTRATVPVIRFARVEARGDRLVVRGTNLDMFLQEEIPAEVQTEGVSTLPAREVYEILSSLEPSMVTLKGSPGVTELATEHGAFRFAAMDPVEFPEFQEYPDFTTGRVELGPFLEGLKLVDFCVAPRNEPRQFLTGILMEGRGEELRLVASDGYRLAFWSRKVGDLTPFEAIVPASSFDLLRTRKELDMEFAVQGGFLWMKFANGWAYTRLLEGPYAPYEEVIPREEGAVLSGETEAMVRMLRRLSLFASAPTHRITFLFRPGHVEAMAESPDQGEAREQVPGEYTGPEMELSFHVLQLREIFQHLPSERFRMILVEPERPVRVEPETQDEESRLLYLTVPQKGE